MGMFDKIKKFRPMDYFESAQGLDGMQTGDQLMADYKEQGIDFGKGSQIYDRGSQMMDRGSAYNQQARASMQNNANDSQAESFRQSQRLAAMGGGMPTGVMTAQNMQGANNMQANASAQFENQFAQNQNQGVGILSGAMNNQAQIMQQGQQADQARRMAKNNASQQFMGLLGTGLKIGAGAAGVPLPPGAQRGGSVKAAPKGYHYMPNGKLMKNSAMKGYQQGGYAFRGYQEGDLVEEQGNQLPPEMEKRMQAQQPNETSDNYEESMPNRIAHGAGRAAAYGMGVVNQDIDSLKQAGSYLGGKIGSGYSKTKDGLGTGLSNIGTGIANANEKSIKDGKGSLLGRAMMGAGHLATELAAPGTYEANQLALRTLGNKDNEAKPKTGEEVEELNLGTTLPEDNNIERPEAESSNAKMLREKEELAISKQKAANEYKKEREAELSEQEVPAGIARPDDNPGTDIFTNPLGSQRGGYIAMQNGGEAKHLDKLKGLDAKYQNLKETGYYKEDGNYTRDSFLKEMNLPEDTKIDTLQNGMLGMMNLNYENAEGSEKKFKGNTYFGTDAASSNKKDEQYEIESNFRKEDPEGFKAYNKEKTNARMDEYKANQASEKQAEYDAMPDWKKAMSKKYGMARGGEVPSGKIDTTVIDKNNFTRSLSHSDGLGLYDYQESDEKKGKEMLVEERDGKLFQHPTIYHNSGLIGNALSGGRNLIGQLIGEREIDSLPREFQGMQERQQGGYMQMQHGGHLQAQRRGLLSQIPMRVGGGKIG